MNEPSQDVVQHRLKRAQDALDDAGLLAEAERWTSCVNRLYYACFYAVSALLAQQGLASSKHTGVRSLFNQHYVKPGTVPKVFAKTYNDLFERRQEGDYMDFVSFEPVQVRSWLTQTEVFVSYISSLLDS